MKNRTCYIFCNSLLPTMGWYTSGPGIRAHQLAYQARKYFSSVKFVFTEDVLQSTLPTNSNRFSNWNRHKDLVILGKNKVADFLSGKRDDVFIFTQTMYHDIAQKVCRNNTVIYDYLACKHLELQHISPYQADSAKAVEIEMAKLSDRVFYNGGKKKKILMEYIGDGEKLFPNPLVPVDKLVNKTKAFDVCFGGEIQFWNNPAKLFKSMSRLMQESKNIKAAFIFLGNGGKDLDQSYSAYISELILSRNVAVFSAMEYINYRTLIASSSIFIDWNVPTKEREMSTSVRSIQSIRESTPVILNKNTDITWFDDFPGFAFNDCPDVDMLKEVIDAVKTGKIDKAMLEADEQNEKMLHNASYFEGI